jgi:hypothetical protein
MLSNVGENLFEYDCDLIPQAHRLGYHQYVITTASGQNIPCLGHVSSGGGIQSCKLKIGEHASSVAAVHERCMLNATDECGLNFYIPTSAGLIYDTPDVGEPGYIITPGPFIFYPV